MKRTGPLAQGRNAVYMSFVQGSGGQGWVIIKFRVEDVNLIASRSVILVIEDGCKWQKLK